MSNPDSTRGALMEMSSPNQHGVYAEGMREELARTVRSFVSIAFARCEDGLYRSSKEIHYSYGGFASPITLHSPGHLTFDAARLAAIEELLEQWCHPFSSDPESVHRELSELRRQVEDKFRQPTLF